MWPGCPSAILTSLQWEVYSRVQSVYYEEHKRKIQARPTQAGQSKVPVYPNSCLEFEKCSVLLSKLTKDKIIKHQTE